MKGKLAENTRRPWPERGESIRNRIIWPALVVSLLGIAPSGFAQTLSQTEAQKLIASDAPSLSRIGTQRVFFPNANTQFGSSVAISGDRALIGAPDVDDPETNSGAAYLYERDGAGTWVEVAKLSPSAPRNFIEFGHSVALSGNRAVVSALRDSISDAGTSVGPVTFVGAVYVFERNAAGTWVDVARLTPSDGSSAFLFGSSVSLSGDRVLVGANEDGHAGPSSGSAYVYERNASGIWSEAAKLTASDAAARDFFGNSVSLSGNLALIGAYRENGGDLSDSGSAYMFERDALGIWAEVAKITAPDARANDFFGDSVSLSDERALIGASFDWDSSTRSNAGSAYVFERSGPQTWVETAKLTASDAMRADFFGTSVSLSGDRALIGARLAENIAQNLDRENAGSAYLFELDATGAWVEAVKYTASDALPSDRLGTSVSVSGDTVLLGAPTTQTRYPGYAYVYDIRSAEGDVDQDGIVNSTDNCPTDRNADQKNFDRDLFGNACDPDGDNDGIANSSDPSPLNPNLPGENGLLPLVVGTVDSRPYGFRFNGVSNYRESLELQFDASGSDLTLTLSGFDIDFPLEVRVLVNGTEIGFMEKTSFSSNFTPANQNGRGLTRLTIEESLLSNTGNTLRFEQSRPGLTWGVTDLLLSEGNFRDR